MVTPIDYKALAERLKEHAALHDSLAAHSDEQRVWADDLRTVVTLLRGIADAAPIYAYEWDTYNGGVHRSFSSAPWNGRGPDRVLVLYTHPAPRPQPIDPHMIAAEDRYPDEPTEAQIEQHPDDAAVDRFAAAMKAKLAEKRAEGRGGWDDPEQCSTTYLATLLRSHVEKGDPLDVGNFAMMLWNRGGATNEMRAALAAKE